MATKKNKTKTKKKVTKKTASAAPRKRSKASPPKKSKRSATARSPRASARKSPPRKPVARRAAPKKAAHAKASGKRAAPPKPIRRRDGAGHLDPHYAATLRKQSAPKEHDARAFLDGPRSPKDDLAEELGEEVIEKATSGEDEAEENLDQIVPEERGGPFVETNAAQEFAHGTDASNPKGAKREPFPRT